MENLEKNYWFCCWFFRSYRWIETPITASTWEQSYRKHFTFNKKAIGWDHAVSADFKEMKKLSI